MAITDIKKKIEPYVKSATGYIKYLLSSDHVVMDNGKTLQEEVNALNSNLSQLKVYRTNSHGDWTIKQYADGWCELYIRLMIPYTGAATKAVNFLLPDGVKLIHSRMQVTPALNGWNIANFYHNNAEQADGSIPIDSIDVVFTPKVAQNLQYNFDVCVSGFLSEQL